MKTTVKTNVKKTIKSLLMLNTLVMILMSANVLAEEVGASECSSISSSERQVASIQDETMTEAQDQTVVQD